MPVKGAWGRGGATNVRLEAAKRKIVLSALGEACANLAKKPARKSRGAG